MSDFDAYSDSYRNEITRAIGRLGDPDVYTEIKARTLIEAATNALGPAAELSALDVGCGPGLTDSFLTPRFGSVVGVDISPEMVERAREANPTARYEVYNGGGRFPFESGAFDLAFAICVLHHVDESDRRDLVAEIVRVTRPGGLVAVFEHNPLNPLTRRVVSRCAFDDDVDLLGVREARHLLAAAGAELLATRYIVFFPWRARVLREAERALASVPFGAQYVVTGRCP